MTEHSSRPSLLPSHLCGGDAYLYDTTTHCGRCCEPETLGLHNEGLRLLSGFLLLSLICLCTRHCSRAWDKTTRNRHRPLPRRTPSLRETGDEIQRPFTGAGEELRPGQAGVGGKGLEGDRGSVCLVPTLARRAQLWSISKEGRGGLGSRGSLRPESTSDSLCPLS